MSVKIKPFRQLYISYKEAQKDLEWNKKQIESRIPRPPGYKEHLDRLVKKVKFYENKILDFGNGSIIEITGKRWEKPDSSSDLLKLEDFKLLLVNTELDEAKSYFKVYMNNSSDLFDKATIRFKEIKTNSILINQ